MAANRRMAELERERQAIFDRLVDLERERATLANVLPMAAHELLSPLQMLLLYTDALALHAARGAPLPADRIKAHTRKMRRQLERMDSLMRAAIEISRSRLVEAPAATVENCDLVAIVHDTVAAHAEEAAAAGCSVSVDAPRALVGPWDANRLRFVVAGLVSNAIKHGGGAPVHIQVVDGGTRAIVRVVDGGPGFAPDDAERLFRAFHKGRGGDGFGLGLWIVRQLASALGGTVTAISAPDCGAAFTVVLKKSAHAASTRRARRRARTTVSKERKS